MCDVKMLLKQKVFSLGEINSYFFCCWDGGNLTVEFGQQDASLVQYRVQHNRLKKER